MKKPVFSKTQTCKMLGCTMQQLNKQYQANAEALDKMYRKAFTTGKKVNGYTAKQLKELSSFYFDLAKS